MRIIVARIIAFTQAEFIAAKSKTPEHAPEAGSSGMLSSEEIIELQDLRMSPIPSIRNRHNNRFTSSGLEEPNKFPPSFRMSRGSVYRPSSGSTYLKKRVLFVVNTSLIHCSFRWTSL